MGDAAVSWQAMDTVPTDGREVLLWGRASQVPSDKLRAIVGRYARGWWSNTHPSMTITPMLWKEITPPNGAA